MAKPATGPIGQRGEEIAARFLRRRGVTIVERNLRSRLGEIDLVGRDGSVVVFVEVKARRGVAPDPPQGAVDARKRMRLARLARGYVASRRLGNQRCRFDVVAVTLGEAGDDARVEHFRGAFRVDGWAG
jgi:putative endonuclease